MAWGGAVTPPAPSGLPWLERATLATLAAVLPGHHTAAIGWDGRDAGVLLGDEVVVEVSFRAAQRRAIVDVMELAELWRLPDAGLDIVDVRSPFDACIYGAASIRAADGTVALLADERLLASALDQIEVRAGVMRWANAHDRQRARRAEAELGPDASASVLTSALAEHLAEAPDKRGVEPDRPLLRWLVARPAPQGVELLAASPHQTEPMARIAGHAARELAVEAWGTTRPDAVTSNRRWVPVEDEAAGPYLHAAQQLEWSDPTGDTAGAVTDGLATIDRVARTRGVGAAQVAVARSLMAHGLTERQALVTVLHRAGMTDAEIGAELKIAGSTVRTLLARGRGKIRAGA